MADFITQRRFRKGSSSLYSPAVGADYTIVIEKYEELTLAVQTHQVGLLKNDESIEHTTHHGVKTGEDGYIQTYNDLPITFMDDKLDKVMNLIDTIRLNGDNNHLQVAFFKGRKIDTFNFIGILEDSFIAFGDPREGENEGLTTPTTLSGQIKGHFYPASLGAKADSFLTAMGGLL